MRPNLAEMSMADPLEIELKLEVAFEDRERLNALPLIADGSGKTDHLFSTYFDTPDRICSTPAIR
jgi:hypothetical protein